MSLRLVRRLDKILVPLTINFYPVERTLHYIRKLFNQILIQYLKLTSRHHQPEVLYKSNNYIIVNKPFDVKINSQDSRDYTVADNLKTAFPELHDQSCVHHFRFTHRLDYPTSGVLCIALNQKAAAKVQRLFVQRKVIKHYLALVGGHLSEPYILVDVPIGRDSAVIVKNKMCPCTSPSCVKVKKATTLIILLQHGTYQGIPTSKVIMVPYTGRTHQLRVHCNLIGHTIIGDYTYSYEKDTEPYRMMLHAYSMTLPLTHEPLDIITPDPFVQNIDSKWRPHKTFKTYKDICTEDLSLQTVQEKDICSLKFHVMSNEMEKKQS